MQDRDAFDRDVQTALPGIAAGGQDDVLVPPQIDRLLLLAPGAEMQRVVEPDRDEGADIRSTVGTDGGDPEQLGGVKLAAGSVP